MAMKIT